VIRKALAKRRFMRAHRWTNERLSEYLDGDLRASERERVDEHLHWCPECRRVLATLRRTVQALTGLRATPVDGVAPRIIERLRQER
jgi:anti-sigma factor RsiW